MSHTESHNGVSKVAATLLDTAVTDLSGMFVLKGGLTIGGEDLNRKDSLSLSGCKLTQGQQPPAECGPRLSVSNNGEKGRFFSSRLRRSEPKPD